MSPASENAPAPWHRRFSVQLLLLVAGLLVAAILFQGRHSLTAQTEALTHSAREHTRTLARGVAHAGAHYLLVGDLAGLEELLLRAAESPYVRRIQVSSETGRVLSQVVRAADGPPRAVFDAAPQPPPEAAREAVMTADGESLDVWEPIGDARLGRVHLRYSLADLNLARRQVLRDTLLVLGVSLLASLALLSLYLSRPLRALKRATAFAADLDAQRGAQLAGAGGPAEIEGLRRSLNRASSELEASHRDLVGAGERLQAVLDSAADAFVTLGLDGVVRSVNRAAERMSARAAADLVGRHFAKTGVVAQHSLARAGQEFAQTLAGTERPAFELELVRADNSRFPVEVLARLVRLDGRPAGVQVTLRDLSERKRLEQLSARLGRILEHSPSEYYVLDTRTLRLTQASPAAQRNLGYSPYELSAMTPLDILPEYTHAQFLALLQPLLDGERDAVSFETVHRRKDGTHYPVEVQLQLSRAETPPVFLAIVQDLTQRRDAETRLAYLANYDALTGLPNRALFAERLGQAVIEADRHYRLVAVLFLDLDNFKAANDTLGHEAGDALLKTIAQRLTQTVRQGDTVARTGGDGFAVVLADIADMDDIALVTDKLRAAVSAPVPVGRHEIITTASIGITVYPLDDRLAGGLLKNADIALHHAKERGRNNFQFFTAELNARAERRFTLETNLRRAIEHGEFVLHYQPQMELDAGAVVGAEALLRWQHPEHGLVPPAEFIPLAEETGLILPIGEWVLREACARTAAWRGAGHERLRVAVNLSGRQLESRDLVRTIARVLDDTALPAGALELEITESILMRNLDETAATLKALAELGVTISMDDFGTGYSSLAYLRRLPIDALKIDRSFIGEIPANRDDAAIASAIIAMARSLDLRVVAEGVETREQADFLRAQRCDGVQGYYFSPPRPPQAFAEFLAASRAPAGARGL